MPTEADPIVGRWYQHLDKGQEFCVVAVNEDDGLVEIQHFDGDLEEIDSDIWYQLDLEPIEEPENWAGPIDFGEIDDLGTEVTDTTGEDWKAPLQEFRATDYDGGDTGDETSEGEWGGSEADDSGQDTR
ncbi:MAG: hypothetical protein PVI91_07855 [Gammaproteobacteria bacterium]|jgi:hypothetical protein